MSHYQPYPKYKNSGVEWLGKVPQDWAVMSIKHIVSTPITDGPHETPDFVDEGIPFVSAEAVSTGSIDFSKIRGFITEADHRRYSQKYHPERGDIFMIKSGATTGVTAIVETDIDFNIWSPLAVIRCGERSLPRFVLNFMRSKSFQEAVALNWSFGTQQNIGMGVIGDIAITVPAIEEQEAIAAHLDRETARIDGLVGKKTRFIELLREKRQALITHAVTKGLDPNVKMKDSGVEWLGEVPEHWEVTPLKWRAMCASGDGISPLEVESEVDSSCEVPVIGGNGTMGYTSKSNVAHQVLAVGRVGALCGNVHIVNKPAWITDNALVLDVDIKAFDIAYLSNVLKSRDLNTIASKTAQPLITGTLLGDQVLPCPGLKEQQVITAYLDLETTRIDSLIRKTERSIELLKERRSALITAAVTGQIDVRGISARQDQPVSLISSKTIEVAG